MTVDEFVASYAAAFATHDAATLAHHFVYPVHVVGDTGGDPSVVTATQDEWLAVLQRLLGAYHELGVARAQPEICTVTELGSTVQLASIDWTLQHADGSAVYEFRACYTIVGSTSGLRISAIAHNELSALQAALDGG
ncbi:MAG TPA: hypothetical protein VFR13_11725 [Jiangellaceae bacterium]|nr:hypothetical protein [Jiangellaceae bacterium]